MVFCRVLASVNYFFCGFNTELTVYWSVSSLSGRKFYLDWQEKCLSSDNDGEIVYGLVFSMKVHKKTEIDLHQSMLSMV